MRNLSLHKMLLLLFVLLVSSPSVWSQEEVPPPVTLETPYNTIYVHLYYLQDDSYEPEKAAQTIYGISDSTRAQRLAIKLKQVFDGKGLYIHLNQLPQEPDYTDTTKQKHYYTPFPNQLPGVYLERIDNSWYYSRETVGQIEELHNSVYPFGTDFLINLFPKFGQQQFLGLYLWQIFGALILVLVVFVIHFFLSRLLNPLVNRLSQSKLYPSLVDKSLTWRLARLLSILLLLQMLKLLLPLLQLPIEASSFVLNTLRILSTAVLLAISLRIIDIIFLYVQRFTSNTDHKMDDQLLPIVKRMVQVVVFIFAIIQILRLLDVNITALIAGIGIGGLALALAAQDTVKNLIGSAMIFIDRPFQIGDWIVGDGFEGGVKEVGFRTTRIQTIDSSIISVPNGTIANLSVTNLGMRTYRLYNATIGVTYDTPAEKIELFMQGMEQMVLAHPMMANEGYLIRFRAFADSSLNIVFRARIMTDDFGVETKVGEEINLALLRLAKVIGVSFAFPSRSLYIETMPTAPAPAAPAVDVATSEAAKPEQTDIQQSFNQYMADFRTFINGKYDGITHH